MSAPRDFEWMSADRWASSPFKPEPTGIAVDDRRGYVHAIACQGTYYEGDHYAVLPLDGGGL